MTRTSPELWIARSFVLLLLAVTGFLLPLPSLGWIWTASLGLLAGVLLLAAEKRIRQARLPALIGAALGLLLAAAIACLASVILFRALPGMAGFLSLGLWLLLSYLGVTLGALKGASIRQGDASASAPAKLLDTSVLIDGRIVEVIEAGFLDGPFLVPEFVLHELQAVADSPDTLKRNRGRRGLDMLQRIRQHSGADLQIVSQNFPAIREVDLKLIEFAKLRPAKLVTNDFNLQKVAQLQGVTVLNMNELASLLKPAVLPGEIMRVFVFKEGKEHNQGVAYLDDGTMVVVDNARRQISKTVEVVVTSVLQTTAGKMIFAKYDEKYHGQAAKAASESRDAL